MRGVVGFLRSLIWTLSTLYFVEIAGLNPLQLVLVGTVLEASVFIFEIPTGIVADVYSRKTSIIIGFMLMGLGYLLQGTTPRFIAILLAQALWGIGHTFTSGADSAWIADELGEENLARVYLRGLQCSQIGALLGIGASVVAARISLGFPIALGGGIYIVLALCLAITMPENAFKPRSAVERDSWKSMLLTFREGIAVIKLSPTLLTLLLIGLFYGLSSEGIDRLWQVHAMRIFPSTSGLELTAWLGIISAIILLLSIGVSQVLTKKADLKNFAGIGTVLVWVNTALITATIAFALSQKFLVAVVFYLILALLRRVNGPLHQAWMNRNIPPQVRATVLSMAGQVDSLGQMSGGPIIGFVASRFTVNLAILLAAAILIPIPFLFSAVRSIEVRETSLHHNQRSLGFTYTGVRPTSSPNCRDKKGKL